MAIGWQQILIVLVIVLVLFGGRGRISGLMGDMAKGINAFKKGLREDDETDTAAKSDASLTSETPATAPAADSTEKTKA